MGTYGTYGPYSQESIVAEFTEQSEGNGHIYKVTEPRSTAFSRHLWGIQTIDGKPVCIVLWLVGKYADEWTYKPMSEEEGPVYYDCPLDLLEKCPVPEDSKWAREWREQVISYHAARKEKRSMKLNVGDSIKLTNGDTGTVVRLGKRGSIVASFNGTLYRVPRSMLTLQ